MRDCLSCGFPDIDADIVAVGAMKRVEMTFGFIEQPVHRQPFLPCGLEITGNMAVWNDEAMARTDRKPVFPDVREFVTEEPPFLVAEWAVLHNFPPLSRLTVIMPSAVMAKEPKR